MATTPCKVSNQEGRMVPGAAEGAEEKVSSKLEIQDRKHSAG